MGIAPGVRGIILAAMSNSATAVATEESATESNHSGRENGVVSTNGSAGDKKQEATEGKTKKVQNGKKSKSESAQGPGDWSFPYRLASEWSVWYDRPSAKKVNRSDYSGSMKHIYQFDSVKAF